MCVSILYCVAWNVHTKAWNVRSVAWFLHSVACNIDILCPVVVLVCAFAVLLRLSGCDSCLILFRRVVFETSGGMPKRHTPLMGNCRKRESFPLFETYALVAHEPVGSVALTSVVYQGLVFVFGLEEAAFCGHDSRCAVGIKHHVLV